MKLSKRFFWPVLVLLLWSASCVTLPAQNLMETLGAIPTNFQLTANQEDLPVVEQYLIQRAETVEDGFRDLGAGYQSWHLAFTSTETIPRAEAGISFGEGRVLLLRFYDAEGQFLFSSLVSTNGFKSPGERSPKDKYYYEIDLRKVPIMVLQDAAQIEIARRWKPS